MTNTCMKDIIAGPIDEKSAIAVAAALTMKKGMLPHQMRTTPIKLSPPVSKPPAIADAFKKKRKEKKLPMELSVTPERAQAIQQAMAETEAACRDVEGLCKGAKGSEKPGHKYISRKPKAGGGNRYVYQPSREGICWSCSKRGKVRVRSSWTTGDQHSYCRKCETAFHGGFNTVSESATGKK